MFPFELSAIDFILVIAVVVLLILYITKLPTRPVVEEKSSAKERIPPKKLAARAQTRSPTSPIKKCPHHFGYLKKLDKTAPIPDECLVCSSIMECFGASE